MKIAAVSVHFLISLLPVNFSYLNPGSLPFVPPAGGGGAGEQHGGFSGSTKLQSIPKPGQWSSQVRTTRGVFYEAPAKIQ